MGKRIQMLSQKYGVKIVQENAQKNPFCGKTFSIYFLDGRRWASGLSEKQVEKSCQQNGRFFQEYCNAVRQKPRVQW